MSRRCSRTTSLPYPFPKLKQWWQIVSRCAGLCVYEGKGGLCSVRLSEPLLKYRPRSDLVNTLLHEMIHAYLFVTGGNTDRDGHGPNFQKLMHHINATAGTSITVYHTFHEEVEKYLTHIWRCDVCVGVFHDLVLASTVPEKRKSHSQRERCSTCNL